MPKSFYSEYVKRKNINIKKIFVFLFVFLLCLVFIAIISVYTGSDIKVYNSAIYAVSAGKYDSIDEAKKNAKFLASKGAAGYIYSKNTNFVLVFAYFTKQDALKIKSNLNEFDVNIIEIKIQKPKHIANEYVIFFNKLEEKTINLYNNIIDFDSGKIKSAEILTLLSQYKKFFYELIDLDIKKLFLQDIRELYDIISDIIKEVIADIDLSSKLKCLFIEIVLNIQNFVSCINA